MADGFFLAAAFLVAIEVEGQLRNRLRQDTHTGIHRRHLHRRALGHQLAGGRTAEIKGIAAARSPVFRFVP
ncbi:hypothetical protein SDC9_197212 [bioreactor metagenome]|uniref:Uncharacterized protein n=1 Tax=bioreactor metagenome TaxID=1076179 RepID=A0A645IEN3_9ZZZZ